MKYKLICWLALRFECTAINHLITDMEVIHGYVQTIMVKFNNLRTMYEEQKAMNRELLTEIDKLQTNIALLKVDNNNLKKWHSVAEKKLETVE